MTISKHDAHYGVKVNANLYNIIMNFAEMSPEGRAYYLKTAYESVNECSPDDAKEVVQRDFVKTFLAALDRMMRDTDVLGGL